MKKLMFATMLLLVPMTVSAQHWYRPTINIENQLESDINLGVNGQIFTIPAGGATEIWNNNRHYHRFDIRFHDWSGRSWDYTQYDGWRGVLQPTTDGDFNLFTE